MSNRPRLLDGTPEPWAVEWGWDRYGLFMSFAVDECVHKLRYIRPGLFVMGSPKTEVGRFGNEGPQHEVTLTQGYWLADTPCTQALWQKVMGDNSSHFRGSDRAVEQVSWDDCQEFMKRLNERVPGLRARLPTEAEWEYGCRAGTSGATWKRELDPVKGGSASILEPIAWSDGYLTQITPMWHRDSASILEPIAWYIKNSGGETKPVRGKEANPWGLYDMLGNVWEWCQDYYGAYAAVATEDPKGAPSGSSRVYRGGSWDNGEQFLRAACRSKFSPDYRHYSLGFRLARGQGDG